MIIGFTGTSHGMTNEQRKKFYWLLSPYTRIVGFHHGDCLGADAESHSFVRDIDPSIHITVHPPLDDTKRAFCKGDTILEPLPYLRRNKNIVTSSARLIATPRQVREQLRSGTWSTIRFAEATKTPYTIIYPDGSYKEF